MIERRTAGFVARFLQGVSFVWAEGLVEVPGRHEGLMRAFRSGSHAKIRSLRWGGAPGSQEWYGEEGWGLSFAML
ncbi:hypothetical protein ACQKGC_02225 [Allorhizobium pseudoryzae]|uniref:hypothetical protein n=1 Tax=Allorhizobium pseudoryzae TaxID=379684 RepID=UPI003D0491B0